MRFLQGWTFSQHKTWPRMPWDADNIVEGNDIHDVMLRLGDGGMIYTLGPQGNRPFLSGPGYTQVYGLEPVPPLKIQPMSQIVRNYLHDNGPSSDRGGGQKAKALYSDDGSTNWNISGARDLRSFYCRSFALCVLFLEHFALLQAT
jgi:hypothetical protein